MTNKKTNSIIAVYAIVACFYLIAFLVIPLPKIAASWVTFAFTLLSFPLSLYTVLRTLGRDGDLQSKFYGFPILKIAVLYPLVQLGVGVILCLLAAWLTVPYWVALLASLLLLGLSAIGVIAADNVRELVEEVEEKTEGEGKAVQTFSLNASSAVALCADPGAKKELEKLSEAIRFSDPVSSDATAAIEQQLQAKLDSLMAEMPSLAPEAITARTIELQNLLAERNRICKANKK